MKLNKKKRKKRNYLKDFFCRMMCDPNSKSQKSNESYESYISIIRLCAIHIIPAAYISQMSNIGNFFWSGFKIYFQRVTRTHYTIKNFPNSINHIVNWVYLCLISLISHGVLTLRIDNKLLITNSSWGADRRAALNTNCLFDC